MSNTTAPERAKPDTTEVKKQKHQAAKEAEFKELTPQEALIDQVSKWYGVEMNDDSDLMQFVKDATKAANERAKVNQVGDPQREAQMSEKIGQLRMQAEGDSQDAGKLNPQQQAFRDALDEADCKDVSISFPDDTYYVLRARGKEDTGSMQNEPAAVTQAAVRLKGDLISA